MTFDWLIVGAGFSGCTLAERIASQLRQTVLLIDRRPYLGGNAADALDPHGIFVHLHGPHIFHTRSREVWNYLSAFTSWRPYQHRVRALVDGLAIPIPFNLDSLKALSTPAAFKSASTLLLHAFGDGAEIPILRLRRHRDPGIRAIATFIYEKVFHNYTLKQWGLPPDQLDPSVTARVPVRLSRDDRYFTDPYQAMPLDGYTPMFERMVQSPLITLRLNTPFLEVPARQYRRLVYTGALDELFAYSRGALPYRSLRFDAEHLPVQRFQHAATVNYPNTELFTRITEMKYLTGQAAPGTTIVREYPQPHQPGVNEPYYPIPLPANRDLHEDYLADLPSLDRPVLALGRLADYRYYNMDQAVARALALFDSLPGRLRT
ncbi:MAG: UDP-galactopyranose mutase [Candidatus Solibacter usitatus]|nr:UDP-galactopyranose mutase [Candidatus Solibacter usitatus]